MTWAVESIQRGLQYRARVALPDGDFHERSFPTRHQAVEWAKKKAYASKLESKLAGARMRLATIITALEHVEHVNDKTELAMAEARAALAELDS